MIPIESNFWIWKSEKKPAKPDICSKIRSQLELKAVAINGASWESRNIYRMCDLQRIVVFTTSLKVPTVTKLERNTFSLQEQWNNNPYLIKREYISEIT